MSTRKEILASFYSGSDEDSRLQRSRHGQMEYAVTMAYIHRYAPQGAKILEVGAGTGRYAIALAREGMNVTAVELLESNLSVLRERSRGIAGITACQGDAVDLGRFPDSTFDMTLVFGPMYHLYDRGDVMKAIDEAIRVTRRGGVILFAFLSVYGIMYANYFYGAWSAGLKENFTSDYRVRHYKEQLFTGYDIGEFERLFKDKPVEYITTAATDGMLEAIEDRPDFALSDEDFASAAAWQTHFAEKRELLGASNHLLYICKKRQGAQPAEP